MNPSDQNPRARSWSRYWASGALHSCPGSFARNYDGALAQFWIDAYQALPPGAQVLDLCTGNGALPRLALGLDGGSDRGLLIDAVDLANVGPPWLAELDDDRRQRVHFHAGVAVEQLPFSAAAFDFVSSQYGIEYADLGRAFSEVARVLRPDGQFQALLHHAESRPVLMGRAERDVLRSIVLAEAGLLASAQPMLALIARAQDPAQRAALNADAGAERARLQFNGVQAQIRSALLAEPLSTAVLTQVRDDVQRCLSLAQQGRTAEAESALRAMREAYQEAELRQHELVESALDPQAMATRRTELTGLGFHAIDIAPLHYRDYLMGWALRATR